MTFVVTAGPTREHLDPVRFLSNPSTGKMGFAVAAAAANAAISFAGSTYFMAKVATHLHTMNATMARR